MSERPDLAAIFSPDVVSAIGQLVDERVAAALAAVSATNGAAPWLTLGQAAERLSCSVDAVRMRVNESVAGLRIAETAAASTLAANRWTGSDECQTS